MRRVVIKGFVQDTECLAIKNYDFRWVLYTAKHRQLVVTALNPKEEIMAEVNKPDGAVPGRSGMRTFSG